MKQNRRPQILQRVRHIFSHEQVCFKDTEQTGLSSSSSASQGLASLTMKVLDVVIQSKATAAVQLRPERRLLCSSIPENTALKVLSKALIKTLKTFCLLKCYIKKFL